MKRMKRHKVKKEKQEPSSSFTKEQEEHDLAYYIHDRVELMHQVFSTLKYKELKAMAPECVRHISIDDLQELCTEELLGISSKRLCAILDGAEPPSDTESSSRSPSPPLETISLDSISSDEEILSETSRSSKKNKKHKRKHTREKSKKRDKRRSNDSQPHEDAERSKASRAGLTVLELLELQARARAIRAQLQKEQVPKQTSESAAPMSTHSSDNEVEIKEEPAEVVEISSEDEKPNIELLEKETQKTVETSISQETATSVTRRINDLVITIPQSKQTRKIKLNRSQAPGNNSVASNTKDATSNASVNGKGNESKKTTNSINDTNKCKSNEIVNNAKTTVESAKTSDTNVGTKVTKTKEVIPNTKTKAKKTKTKKKKKVKLNVEEDHDEITLQLSDSEKMDLLEDLDRKNLDNVSSSSEDTESSSDASEEETSLEIINKDKKNTNSPDKLTTQSAKEKENLDNKTNMEVKQKKSDTSNKNDLESCTEKEINISVPQEYVSRKDDGAIFKTNTENTNQSTKVVENNNDDEQRNSDKFNSNEGIVVNKEEESKSIKSKDTDSLNETDNKKENNKQEERNFNESEKETTNLIDIRENEDIDDEKAKNLATKTNTDLNVPKEISITEVRVSMSDDIQCVEIADTSKNRNSKETMDCTNTKTDTCDDLHKNIKDKEKLSDGELTDNESSEVEVTDLKQEVVCISDEEVAKKKKKKKDKKKKKSKKKSDFRNGDDQNFYEDKTDINIAIDNEKSTNKNFSTKIEAFSIKKDSTDNENNKTLSEESEPTDKTLNRDDKNPKDNIYIIVEDEILILSDDSSCFEVDTYLSKEPTAEEIEALSLKIDEINRDEIISDSEIREHERQLREKENSDVCNNIRNDAANSEFGFGRNDKSGEGEKERDVEISSIEEENISWKDRYLGSKKVRKVLSTANIFNALRKKNIELKKRLEEKRREDSKKEEEKTEKAEAEVGSVEHYNTLQGSTKYVDPIKDDDEKKEEEGVTREMKRDAKQLLKMYKKLLKYNDMNRVKDPSKRKKKKKNKES